MKQRERARLLKQRLSRRVQDYDTEEELFAAVREHRRSVRDKLNKNELAFLREVAELHRLLSPGDCN